MSNNETTVNATTPETTATTAFAIPTATSLREERENFINAKAKELAYGVLKKVEELFAEPKEKLFCKLHKGELRLYKANQNSNLLRDAIVTDSTPLAGLTGKILDEVKNASLAIVKTILEESGWTIDAISESYEFSGPVVWVVLREI